MAKDSKQRKILLEKMLAIIRKKPGIRPNELNNLLCLKHSWNCRSTLIKRNLIKKEKDGIAVRYYPL